MRAHLVVNADYPFERLAERFAGLGFELIPPVNVGEVVRAEWRARGAIVRCEAEPLIGFSGLEIEGAGAAAVAATIVEGAQLTVGQPQVSSWLESLDPRTRLRGLRAAGWIGRGEDHKYYWERVAWLKTSGDKAVASAAARVYEDLMNEAGGRPIVPGLRGTPLVWELATTQTAWLQTRHGDASLTLRGGTHVVGLDGYTLLVDGRVVETFTEWPAAWQRPAPPPPPPSKIKLPARPDGLTFTYRTGMEHNPSCGGAQVVTIATNTVRLDHRRGGGHARWEAEIDRAVVQRLLDLLRTARFPAVAPQAGPPRPLPSGTSFDSLEVADAGGAKDAVEFRSDEAEPAYKPAFMIMTSLIRTLSGRTVGFERPGLPVIELRGLREIPATADALVAPTTTDPQARAVAWSATGNVVVPYLAEVSSATWILRLNDFPEEPMYTLFIDGREVYDLDDFPACWSKPHGLVQLARMVVKSRLPGWAEAIATKARGH